MKGEARVSSDPLRLDSDAEASPLDFKLIVRLMGFTRPYAKKRNVLLVMVLLRSVQLPLLAWAIGAAINGPITAGDIPGIWLAGLGFGLFALFTQVTFCWRVKLALELGESVIHDLRAAIYRHLLCMPMSFFHKTRLGRIIGRVTSDTDAVRIGVQDVLFISMVQAGQMIFAAVMMIWYDWVMFSAVLAMAPIIWGLNMHFKKKLSTVHRSVQESFSRVTSSLAESVNGIRVTQGFARQEVNTEVFRQLVESHSRHSVGAARTTAVFLPLLELNSQIFIAILLFLGGYRTLNPEIAMPIGDLIYFFLLANLFFEPIRTIGNQYTQALSAMAGAERVFALLDRKPEWQDLPGAQDIETVRGEVEFRDVHFSYDPGKPVLHGINLRAPAGSIVALVGHTGSGKSSIVNLLAKFYLPDKGTISIDGIDLRDIRGESLRRQVGIVLQTNFLFSGTVLDNIRLAKPDATEEEARAAAEQLGCADLIEALPGGLNAEVGERGSNLSLGQRQLVCFTRAMIANPSILIMDEATSSVDTMTEARIQKALNILLDGRTSFIVAHRLSTIRHATEVLVLDHGRVVERGTHDRLVALEGTYAKLYRQFVHGSVQ